MIFGKYINKFYLRYAPLLLVGLIALAIVDYMNLVVPGLYQLVINGVNQGYVMVDGVSMVFDMEFLLDQVCMPLVVVILCIVFGRFTWRSCLFSAAIHVETNLRNQMFDHVKDLSQDYFQVNKVGNLMSLFTNDLNTVQECFGMGFIMFFDALLLGVMSLAKMWRMDHFLTMLALIPMLLLLSAASIIGRRMAKKWDARQAAFSSLSDFSQESFSGISVIKAFVKEAKDTMAFKKLNDVNEETNVSYTKAAVLLKIMTVLFIESVICIILGYGGYLVYRGIFNAGQLIEFIGYFVSIIWPCMAVSELIDRTAKGKASLKRISQLLDATVTVKDRPGVSPLPQIKGDIEFRDLTFRYPDGEYDALQNVSFTIHAGENIGLVGKTGSGKTTLVDLILRTYNVPDGTLFIDSHDVNTVSIRDLRAGCAYVPQDNFLFSDTISNNISFGTRQQNPDAVRQAAVLADVDSNIQEFGHGYETVLGERGVTVSGGQKQRISIARALMKEAPILILDDSVSAVDTKTEHNILENLRTTRAGKTTILIAHRISTIEKMDRILFINDTRLEDVGTHQELYSRCPDYRKMVDLQRLEEEGGEHENA